MQTNWMYWDGNYYFLGQKNDGSLETAWFYDSSYKKWFYADDNGELKTGWLKDDTTNNWYYLQPEKTDKYALGEMRTGWINDKGNDYCLYSNGSMISNCDIYGYRFDSNGVASKI